jgi:hypothetical protein
MKSLTFFISLMLTTINTASALANNLAIGPHSRMSGTLDVPINKLECFNFKKENEIINMRKMAVRQCPSLMLDEYEPSEPIFGQIESGKPWWGFYGRYIYRKGHKSIEGPSKESPFILNPYLLVGIEGPNTSIWNPARINPAYLTRTDFPLCWNLVSLKWTPKQAKAEATYDVSKFQNQLSKWQAMTTGYNILKNFSLIAYNARDFGLDYIYVCKEESENIDNINSFNSPIRIIQMLHCGDSCGYPGGCNNMSPHVPVLDNLSFTKLPAKIQIYLWHDSPSSTKDPADMTFTIYLK